MSSGSLGVGVATFVSFRPLPTRAFVLLLSRHLPVVLRFGSKDALTTGTLVHPPLSRCSIRVTRRCVWTREDRLVVGLLLGLILIGAIGAITGGGQ